MIPAATFLDAARNSGFDFFTGVPCSFLTPIINRLIGDARYDYVAASSEGEAVAIASGAWLAGRGTAVMFQNSGLGNAVNPLTSLNYPFKIPTLLLTTWRAGPGLKDEPQHELMGAITPALLDVLRIPHLPFPNEAAAVQPTLDELSRTIRVTDLPFALIMEKGDVEAEDLAMEAADERPRGMLEDRRAGGEWPTRMAAMERMLSVLSDNAAVVATTGKCGRELFTLADRAQHLYQVGSMGCAAAMGLGVALNVDNPVVVLDGDGALLMKMGSLATIGAEAPENLIHIVLDNATYDSTGGQPTVSPTTDFAQAAIACGYRHAAGCDDLAGFEAALAGALKSSGPHLIHVKILSGSMRDLGRPTVTPDVVARRFRDFLTKG